MEKSDAACRERPARWHLLHEALDLWRAVVRPELRITGVPFPEVEDILIFKIVVDLHNTRTGFCQAFLKRDCPIKLHR